MRTAVAIIVCVISAPLSAQWLNYPTPGIPRLPDGKPNLAAPAPRTPDGKPDLSGIWGLPCPVGNAAAVGSFNGQPNVYCATEVAIPPEFGNIGQSLTGGLPYQPWAAELVKKTRAANRPDDPMSRCLPPGIVRLDVFPLFRKMVQVPGLLVILNEQNASYRQIFTDGRPLPVGSEPVLERLLFGEMGRGHFGRPDHRFSRRALAGHRRTVLSRMPPESRKDSGA